MRVALVYNIYDSVSGETVFFKNMIEKMGEKVEVVDCGIPQKTSGITGKFDFYSRIPVLSRARKKLKGAKCDIVHFLNSALSPASNVLGRQATVATTHFTARSYLRLSPPASPLEMIAESAYCSYVESLDRPAFQKMDRVVACSGYQMDYLRDNYSLQNAVSIPPGIDNDYFRKLPKRDLHSDYGSEKIIVYAGRLHERSKGVSYAIRAMKHLDARLLVIGDGPDRKNYKRLVRDLDLAQKITFLGKMDFREKSMIQKSADAVVMPSLYEVYGTVFAESLSCGVPVVAFDMPFWKGLYEGAGIFTKKDDRALAQGIRKALDDKKLRADLIMKGKALAEKHDISRTIDSYLALYDEL
jgi:glycosyltransferase involved in cell wall biosynthesis